MKTITTILFLFIAIICNAQFKFTSNNENDMRTISDSIVSNSKIDYKFHSKTMVEETYLTKLVYVNVSDSTDKMVFFYKKTMKGKNNALEIIGTPEYEFRMVIGKFISLFPFWNKYIDNKATKEIASTEINFGKNGSHKFVFSEIPEYAGTKWRIEKQ